MAEHGQFADAHLNATAKAIVAADTTALQALLVSYKTSGTVSDYAERDPSMVQTSHSTFHASLRFKKFPRALFF